MEAMAQTQSALKEHVWKMGQKMVAVETKLQMSDNQSEELKEINQAQHEQLNALKQSLAIGQIKMAFSVALGSSMGPFEQDMPLKYQRILCNIGSGYNPATGIFTAMVQGMYYFSYTVYNNNSAQPNSAVSLMLNSQKLVSTWNTEGDDSHESATNAAVVELMAGDSVFVQLYAKRALYDDGYYYNTFSGFLLFTL
ncbi:complement C1q-like protein 2 [Lampris incognitus]|uniref:complement C1q-like protein 2 n=1 Tax=Lampris incognitus TaxID=2546036 RepID=UPI0024B4A762|nr:complement C1q-like protein 2 [Lampris incognitus]